MNNETLQSTTGQAAVPPPPPATTFADPENEAGRAILTRVGDYLSFGVLPNPGQSTAQFDEPEAAPVEAAPVAPTPAVPSAPVSGDLFTDDFATFHRVTDSTDLTATRASLVLHVSAGVDWKDAIRGYLDLVPGTHVWEANGGDPQLIV